MKELNLNMPDGTMKPEPWDKSDHPIYKHPLITPLFNEIGGIKNVNGMFAYLDYVELPVNGSTGVFGLKIFMKSFALGEDGVKSNQELPEEVYTTEFIQNLSRKTVQHLFELGTKNFDEITEKQGDWWNSSLSVKPGPNKIKTSFWKNPIQWIKDLFKPRVEYVFSPGQESIAINRKLVSKILALSNIIAINGRRGPANTVIVGAQIATALQDSAGFVSDGLNVGTGIYRIGTMAGLAIYVDPYMNWNDNRILVYRRGGEHEPGLFLPYLKQDEDIKTIVIAEGVKAPEFNYLGKYAVIECGFTPHKNYIVAEVDLPEQGLI